MQMATPVVHPSGRPNLVMFNVVGVSSTSPTNVGEAINNYNTALGQMFMTEVFPKFRSYVNHTTFSDYFGGAAYSRTSQFVFVAVDGDYDANGEIQIQTDFVVGLPPMSGTTS